MYCIDMAKHSSIILHFGIFYFSNFSPIETVMYSFGDNQMHSQGLRINANSIDLSSTSLIFFQ